MDYKVTVIVPVYNAMEYIDRCLDSVVNQTYSKLQIILVDDGSTDDSGQLCDTWAQKDNRIQVIHKENAGAGMARNTGLEYVTGDYVLFVDSDDYIAPDTVRKCVDSIIEHGSDTVVFGYNFASDKGDIVPENINAGKLCYDKDGVQSELLPSFFTLSKGFEVSVWGKLFSAEIIRDNALRFLSEREMYSEDALFLLRYFPKCKCASIVDENLYFYCDNDASISRVYEKDKQNKLSVFLQNALEIATQENIIDRMKLHILARYQSCAMVEYKQIVLSDMSMAQKLKEIKDYSNTDSTQQTLRKDVIALHPFAMRMFYTCIRRKMYLLSYLLLWLRLRK